MLKLSIVIVSYNTKALLEESLDFLSKAEYSFDFEIIVVDNNSRDGCSEMVKSNYHGVRLICNNENVGFARACNTGIKQACGKYVLFLNPDTKIVNGALEKLTRFLDTHGETGVVTARVVHPDMTDQGVARTFPTPMSAVFGRRSILTGLFPNNRWSRKYLTSRQHKSDEPFEADWVSGACLMVRKQILDEVGLFDEKFFMYWEDADLCYRIKEKGWKVYCVADATIIHYEGKSTGRKTARLIVEFNKSVYYYYRKHYIHSSYGLKNLAALSGLVIRTLILLLINSCRMNCGKKKKIVAYEKNQS